jgi:hypothetical protein
MTNDEREVHAKMEREKVRQDLYVCVLVCAKIFSAEYAILGMYAENDETSEPFGRGAGGGKGKGRK